MLKSTKRLLVTGLGFNFLVVELLFGGEPDLEVGSGIVNIDRHGRAASSTCGLDFSFM